MERFSWPPTLTPLKSKVLFLQPNNMVTLTKKITSRIFQMRFLHLFSHQVRVLLHLELWFLFTTSKLGVGFRKSDLPIWPLKSLYNRERCAQQIVGHYLMWQHCLSFRVKIKHPIFTSRPPSKKKPGDENLLMTFPVFVLQIFSDPRVSSFFKKKYPPTLRREL